MSAPVAFFCRNPKHRSHPDIISNAITINEGERAFCPFGAVDEHLWERIQSANVDALKHPLAREERVTA
jgi:hypothetical protein